MESSPTVKPANNLWDSIRKSLYILGTLLLFVFALELMVTSLQHLGSTAAATIVMATSNPFTALFIGLLSTAMIQSSSTTTSLVVALVASGSIPIQSAIPIIMGANVGTTITSTIVSLGFINKKKEFRRAVSAGTYHDFFNILTVIILFPLQYYYGFLSSIADFITHYFHIAATVSRVNTGWNISKPVFDFIIRAIPSSFVLTVISFVLLFTSIILFRRLISNLLLVRFPDRFRYFFFQNQFMSFFWGLSLTAVIRSSTVTTSLVVPLVAKKIVLLRQAAPFILGANIGTTITAFIAAILYTDSNSAISIAVAHFLFNLIGVLIFFPIPFLRRIPFKLALGLGTLTLKYRLAGFVYILSTFFFIPFSLIYFNPASIEQLEAHFRQTDASGKRSRIYRIDAKMNKTTKMGEYVVYPSADNKAEPEKIFPFHRKSNALFIHNAMYLFAEPGTCWNGANVQGKYTCCVREILPRVSFSGNVSADSVYVFEKTTISARDTTVIKYYVSVRFPLILKTEIWNSDSLKTLDEVIALEKK